MGTAANQIATRTNVNAKRINAFTASTKCVTKAEVQSVEFLTVSDRKTSTTISGSLTVGSRADTKWNSCWGVAVNGGTASASYPGKPYCSSMYGYVTYNGSTTYYQSSTSYLINCKYQGISYNNSSVTTIQGAAMCSKSISTTAGKYTMVTISATPYCNANTSSTLNTSYNVAPNSATNTWYVVAVSGGKILANSGVKTTYTSQSSATLYFTPDSSTTTIYFVPVSLDMKFYPILTGSLYVYAGFLIGGTVTTYQSYYDSTNKCAQYADISHPTGKTFTVYYGIWNNKSSNAKVDHVNVQIKKPADTDWAQIGNVNIDTVSGTKTGSVLCTLPTGYDPTTTYDFRVVCGSTTFNQTWKYRWGTQSSVGSSGYSWTTYSSSAKTGVCGPVTFNANTSTAPLKSYDYSSGTSHYGRTTSYAALFQIS